MTTLTQEEIDRRMAKAAQAAEGGDHRTAAHLYDQLGRDIQSEHGRFDARALDAFEGVARVIGEGANGDGGAK